MNITRREQLGGSFQEAAGRHPEFLTDIRALCGNPRHDITSFHQNGTWTNGRLVVRAGAEDGGSSHGEMTHERDSEQRGS